MVKKTKAKKTQTQRVEQNESHDWLGEAAENYVRYLFAREGFRVFAGSKWGADLAVHEMHKPNKWWCIEVRSTDKKGRGAPRPKSKAKLEKIADFVINVKLIKNKENKEMPALRAEIYPVERANKNGSCDNPDVIYLDGTKRGLFFGKGRITLLDYLNGNIN